MGNLEFAEINVGDMRVAVESTQTISTVETTMSGIKVTFASNHPKTMTVNIDGKALSKVNIDSVNKLLKEKLNGSKNAI